MQPLRIAHCVLEPRYSGAEMLVLNLIRAQATAGVHSALIALRPPAALFQTELAHLSTLDCDLFVPPQPLVRHHRIRWIRRAAQKWRPNVLFAHSVLPSVYCRLGLLGVPQVSLVTVLHTDTDFDDSLLRVFELTTWRKSAVVVGVSPASLRNYQRLISRKARTQLIENGVDFKTVRAASPTRTAVREEIYRAAPDEVILLQVGRISPQKQQRHSVEALAALGRLRSLDKITLIFAGLTEDAGYHEEVEAAAAALGVASRVRFLGARNDVANLLAGADAHLMPSGWEAHGIVPLEALASGIFCVFTPIESFLTYRGLSGVEILPEAAGADVFATRLATAIDTHALRQRYERDLGHYEFSRCAREYLELSQALSGPR